MGIGEITVQVFRAVLWYGAFEEAARAKRRMRVNHRCWGADYHGYR